jgi:hypothetical protein
LHEVFDVKLRKTNTWGRTAGAVLHDVPVACGVS